MVLVQEIIGWAIYAAFSVLVLLCSLGFVRYYNDSYEENSFLTAVSTASIGLSFLTLLIVPLDVISVSSSLVVQSLVQSLYYIAFLLMMVLSFIVVPFAYFFFEEGADKPLGRRILAGVKWTIPFIFAFLIIFVLGFVLPVAVQDEEDAPPYVQQLLDSTNLASTAVDFMIACLACFGFFVMWTYTAFGFTWFPISWIKGPCDTELAEEDYLEREIVETRTERRQLQSKLLSSRSTRTARDAENVSLLKRRDEVLQQRREHLGTIGKIARRCQTVTRPIGIVIGTILLLVMLVIVVSFILTSVDKLSPSAASYVLSHAAIFNPLDSLLTLCAPLFPLDYVVFTVMVVFMWFATVSGISRWGIRALWIELFPIAKGRSAPQGLLLMGVLLMLVCVTLAFSMGTLAPKYTMWGHQQYLNNGTWVPCDAYAPFANCSMTQLERLTSVVKFKFGFFRYVLYWANWVFVASWFVCLFLSICLRFRGQARSEKY